MQTKTKSLLETLANTFIGFIITLAVSPLIYYLAGIEASPAKMGLATLYFTVLSVLRGYIIRRWFNKK